MYRERVSFDRVFKKKDVGAASGSIIHHLVNDYGGNIAARFIDDLQKVMLCYMKYNGFSVGLSDCLLSKTALKLIDNSHSASENELSELISKKEDKARSSKNSN